MTGQLDLFSGEELRDRGADRVSENAGEWTHKARARALLFLNSRVGWVVTSDEWREVIEQEIGDPHKGNAWSALTLWLVRIAGRLREVPGKRKSERRSNHARRNQKYLVLR